MNEGAVEPFRVQFESEEAILPPGYKIVGPSRLRSRIGAGGVGIMVSLPSRTPSAKGSLVFDGRTSISRGRPGFRSRLMNRFRRPVRLPGLWIDLRPLGLVNWSHALNAAIPLALFARDRVLEHGGTKLSVVLPEGIPSKAVSFFQKLGFEFRTVEGPVEAKFVRLETSARLSSFARAWVDPHASEIRSLLDQVRNDLPERFFVDRRRGRHLLNGEAVRDHLRAQGFAIVYPEDLTLEEQLALFIRAKDIVAIHGAGLAPLLYRKPEDGPFRLIEIQSPGHMTGFFRHLTRALPVDYRSVRGNPDKKMLADYFLEDSDLFAARHSLSPFEVDMKALAFVLRPERVEDIIAAGRPL